MNLSALLEEIQVAIQELQTKVNIIRAMESGQVYDVDILLTRKEAAEFIGRSIRQLDRLCDEHKIKREVRDGAIRIRRSELMMYKGLIVTSTSPQEALSEFDRIFHKYR